MNKVLIAVLLTALAGISTGIGGLTAFFSGKMNNKVLSFTLGISAGVMIYVSFAELYIKAGSGLISTYGLRMGSAVCDLSFFGGMALVAFINRFVPESFGNDKTDGNGLLRTGAITAIVLAIHNFPEGMATFMSAYKEPTMAIPIVAAIAIHNIPEGIAVAVPVYFATSNKWKAFRYTLYSGLTEPLGALTGYLLLMPFMTETVESIVFSAVAGVMIYISFAELLPAAQNCNEQKLSIMGLVSGMMIMAVSLICLR